MKKRLKGLLCCWLAITLLCCSFTTALAAESQRTVACYYTGTDALELDDNVSFREYEDTYLYYGDDSPTLNEQVGGLQASYAPENKVLVGWNLWGRHDSGDLDVGPIPKEINDTVSAKEVETCLNGNDNYYDPLIEARYKDKYIIDPQPTNPTYTVGAKEYDLASDSYIVTDDVSAYQWYGFGQKTFTVIDGTPGDDEIAVNDVSSGTYTSETGEWVPAHYEITVYLSVKSGDIITVTPSDAAYDGPIYLDYNAFEKQQNGVYTYQVTEDNADIELWIGTYDSPISFDITIIRSGLVEVSGQTTATLTSGVDRAQYCCKLTFPGNVILTSDPVTYLTPYTVTASANNAAYGTVSGGGTYNEGATVTLTAAPETGYAFKEWQVVSPAGLTITDNKFTMPAEDVSINAVFEEKQQVKKPVLPEGGTFSGTKEITIICETADVDIYYTLDGADPTAASTKYTGAFTINSSAVIRAVAIRADGSMLDSEVAQQVFVLADDDDFMERIEEFELTDAVITEGLKDAGFVSVDEVEETLEQAIASEENGAYENNVEVWDVKLQFSLDGGSTWIDATEDNFPTEGITTTLPYPSGTGRDTHDFFVTHMFTVNSARLGTTAGQTEEPAVTETEDGIRVTLKGLSPVAIGYKAAAAGGRELTITTTGLPDGTVGRNYSQKLEAEVSGGITGIGWHISQGTLPDGLTLDTYNGMIEGIPTKAGTFRFTVVAFDAADSVDDTQDLSITIQSAADDKDLPMLINPAKAPVVTEPVEDQTTVACVGSTVTMEVEAENGSSYQWYVDRGNGFVAIAGANKASYTTSPVELGNDGYRYYCKVTNRHGSDVSPVFTLAVVEYLDVPKTGGTSISLFVGAALLALAGCVAGFALYKKKTVR